MTHRSKFGMILMVCAGLSIVGVVSTATHKWIVYMGPVFGINPLTDFCGSPFVGILLLPLIPLFLWGYRLTKTCPTLRWMMLFTFSMWVLVATLHNFAIAPAPTVDQFGNQEFGVWQPADNLSFGLGYLVGGNGLALAAWTFLRRSRPS